ncbi:MAG: prephenate dehydratase [Methanomassiliicoccales archaeon]
MKVAYQGERGSYSEEALISFFKEKAVPVPFPTISDVFRAVENSVCEAGIIPVENSIGGNVYESYDNLLNSRLHISGETFLRIRHCLIAIPGSSIEGVLEVYSHPQALEQCRNKLEALGVSIKAAYDTAGSVKLVRERNDLSIAAVASKRAAELYGLEVLIEGIEDFDDNFTRFLIISKEEGKRGEENKTTVVFSVENRPGALYKALSIFANAKINLTKIESRPTKRVPWEYYFIVDFDGHIQERRISDAVRMLEKNTAKCRILGSYARGKIE